MSLSSKKTIDVIVPVLNEANNLPILTETILDVWQQLEPSYRLHMVFVNDGSTDTSLDILHDLAKTHKHIEIIDFSRNFGKEAAVTAGLNQSKGDAAILIDADLQHPPDRIPDFIKCWEEGAEVVIGERQNQPASLTRRASSWLYYKTLKILTGEAPIGRSDFRLLDRAVISEFNRLTEHDRMARDLIDWLGFRCAYVEFEANDRANGDPNYSYSHLIHLALTGFMANSLFPLKVAGYLGIFMMVVSLTIGAITFTDRLILGNQNFSGPFMSSILNMFLTSLTLISLGLIALYVGSIKNDTRNRPLYIVRKHEKHAQTELLPAEPVEASKEIA